MNVIITPTALKDLVIVETKKFVDNRGFFTEVWNKQQFQKVGVPMEIVQVNYSQSKQNVLRGLHFQDMSAPLNKLIRCVKGEIFDVSVDLRIDSPTFGKWFGIQLSEDNAKQIFVPVGFAHGFIVLSQIADVEYQQTGYYTPNAEKTIMWNDPDLAISWPNSDPIVSEKDQNGISLEEYKLNPFFS